VQLIRHHLRQFVWIALVAILGVALAPTVSHAQAGRGAGNPWAEICSAAAAPATPQAPPAVHLAHCPLCSHAGADPVLPQAPVVVPARRSARHDLPAAPLRAGTPVRAWAIAQPRAPPTSA